ncbi:MAG: acyl carrier protein [Frankia sp.]|nr:acyl carrier protein [Frankia sp.]
MTPQETLQADPELSALEARVLDEVAAMLREVIGEEYVANMEITMDTSFAEDLELESIEFVTLSAQMRDRYGESVDFVGFLAELDVDRVIAMRVGDVVRFIAASLAEAGQAH